MISNASEEVRAFGSQDPGSGGRQPDGKRRISTAPTSSTTGMIGMHGTKASNFGVTECDLLIVVGARFSDRVCRKCLQVCEECQDSSDRCRSGRDQQKYHGGRQHHRRCEVILSTLNACVRIRMRRHDEWVEHIERLKDKYPAAIRSGGLTGPYVVEEHLPGNQGRCDHRHRGWPASDVGGTVL